jgi:hypothetical protein
VLLVLKKWTSADTAGLGRCIKYNVVFEVLVSEMLSIVVPSVNMDEVF